MELRSFPVLFTACALLVTSAVCASAADEQYRGWGPRVGLADDPDQILLGAHFDLGELTRHVRFLPNVELGLGDDHTVLALTAPVHYRWEELRDTEIIPYAGGGLTAGLIDRDDNSKKKARDDTDFEFALRAIGGAEWPLSRRRSFFIEFHLVFGDVHDVQAIAGWNLGRR